MKIANLLAAAEAINLRPRHVAAVAMVSGLALCRVPDPAYALVGAAATLGLLASGARLHVAALALAVFVLAGALGQTRLHAIDADPLARVATGATVTLTGDLVERPKERADGGSALRMRARLPSGRGQLVEVTSYGRPPVGIAIGDGVSATGRLVAVDPDVGTAQSRSYARHLLLGGVRRRLRSTRVVATGTRRGGVFGFVDSVRRRSDRTLAIGLAPESAALLRGMVLGGDAGIPEATTDDFRVAGLSHILAVSGQNVMLLVILMQAIATAVGAGRIPRLVVPVVLICLYVPLCGAQASVVRAGAMGLAGLAAMLASRPADRIYALLLGSIAVLAWNPRATADIGAQLSFAAVLGIVAFAKPVARRLQRWPSWVAEGFAVTFGATLATAPLMAYHFGAVSLVSLAANVLGEPLIGPIVWLGSLAAAIGQLDPSAGALLNVPNEFLLGSLISLAHTAAAVPGAQVTLPRFDGLALVAVTAPVVYAALATNGMVPRPRLPSVSPSVARPGVAFAIATAAAFAVAWTLTPTPMQLPRPAIVFLDVGQGDATLMLGREGCTALIDGGPPGTGIVARLRRIGVEQLDLVIATHPQLDHDGGLGEIAAAGRPVVKTLFDGGGNTDDRRFLEIRDRFAADGVRSRPAVEGESWTCGDLSVRLLGPRALAPGAPPPADPNIRAAVVVAHAGPLTMLASGDAESPQLLPLPLPPVDVLKVSHHGSADDGLQTLLSRVDPRLAAIEVGAGNRYGHPTPQALSALEASGASVFRTDRDGTIAVFPNRSGQPEVRVRIE